jgi:predicted O-methyltransferase YrrM
LDLKEKFLKNMEMLGLSETINLLDMPNNEAIEKLSGIQIRFLFIDGDHTKEGVTKDIELFFPKLLPGALVVFDDFSEDFPGLIEAVDHLLRVKEFSRVMSYHRTLVLQI